jgi:Family of unknown function (DUF5681)
MNDESTKKPAGAVRPYEVGYGKPPVHTRFRKGVSGNPRGGSRRVKLRRARGLAIKEAYRLITVREGDKVTRLPALQAVMRSQVALAAKGNGPAQRALIAAVHALEQEMSAEFDEAQKAGAAKPQYTIHEAARRIAFLLQLAKTEPEEPPPGDLKDRNAFLTETREKKEETKG